MTKLIKFPHIRSPRLNRLIQTFLSAITLLLIVGLVTSIYLSRPKYPLKASLLDNQNINFTSYLINNINLSQKTIDIAVYSIDSLPIKNALYQAAQRGVSIRLILNASKNIDYQSFFTDTPPNFSIVYPKLNGYMHHKFAIFDSSLLCQSSLNLTNFQTTSDTGHIFQTSDPTIVTTYLDHFNSLFDNHPYPADPLAQDTKYLDGFFQVWFSPGQVDHNPNIKIVSLINQAHSSIKIISWLVTDPDIAKALNKKASQGVPITIITDDYNITQPDSIIPTLKNINILYDQDPTTSTFDINRFLHHHALIVDESILAFGTNNWSKNASLYNSEDMIVTNIPSLVQSYLEIYNQIINSSASK